MDEFVHDPDRDPVAVNIVLKYLAEVYAVKSRPNPAFRFKDFLSQRENYPIPPRVDLTLEEVAALPAFAVGIDVDGAETARPLTFGEIAEAAAKALCEGAPVLYGDA